MSTNLFRMFMVGAAALATPALQYKNIHKSNGISSEDWRILTLDVPWVKSERLKIPSILSAAINVSITLAQLPPTSLPAQYVAALICALVRPCNRLVAVSCAPETYDAVAASGIAGEYALQRITDQQMMSLVIAYSAEVFIQPNPLQLEDEQEVALIGASDAAVRPKARS